METTSTATNTTPFATNQNKNSFPIKRVSMGVAIILVDVLAIYLMIKYGNSDVKALGYETIKISIQLLLVVLFGGIFIQEYNRARARKATVNDLRRTILRDLSRAYSDVKGVRRILRAKCESTTNNETRLAEDCLPLPVYDLHISTINATQLELEIMVRELGIITGIFKEQNKLSGYIKRMEKYLNGIIREYETTVKKYRGKTSISLSELPRLKALMLKSAESDFDEFASSYKNALLIIQEERVKVA